MRFLKASSDALPSRGIQQLPPLPLCSQGLLLAAWYPHGARAGPAGGPRGAGGLRQQGGPLFSPGLSSLAGSALTSAMQAQALWSAGVSLACFDVPACKGPGLKPASSPQPAPNSPILLPTTPPSRAQGEGLESAIACPAWAPVLSLESIDGQLWREMRDEFDALMKQLPPPARLQVGGAFSWHGVPIAHALIQQLPPAAGLQGRAPGIEFRQQQQLLSSAMPSPSISLPPPPVASQP